MNKTALLKIILGLALLIISVILGYSNYSQWTLPLSLIAGIIIIVNLIKIDSRKSI